MTTTESYTAAATQTRRATERSVEAFKQGTKTLVEQANVVAKLPKFDLTEPVTRYFEYVQKSIDFNRDLATRWAELMTSLSGSVRERAESFSHVVADQTEKVADLTAKQTEKAEQVAKANAATVEQAVREQAEKAERAAKEQAERVEQAAKEQARLARQTEREQAKRAHEQARAPYQSLTKAELADLLVERGLPKTGNVEDLIERLVSADSE